MNKLTIISICIILSGFFVNHALALDNINDLSASEFFYGESVDNNDAAINTPVLRVIREAALPYSGLDSSDFFYGQTIDVPSQVLIGDNRPQRTEVVEASDHIISPEVFYGYTDVIEVTKAPCANC
jgi:hypothetical protein